MPRRLARVSNSLLYPVDGAAEPIPLDTSAWYAWLDEHTSFSFETLHGALTIRKERGRPSGHYWKAYHRSGGRVRTAYLGRSAELTHNRLGGAAARLTRAEADPAPLETPASISSPYAGLALGDPVLPIRLRMPALRPNLVPRPRLLDRLRSSALPPLILLTAPAGYGKTTLLTEWVTTDRRAAAWVSIDSSLDNPNFFWEAVAGALSTLHPAAGARTLHLLHGAEPPSLETMLATLISDLRAYVQPVGDCGPALLILDDYHVITQRAIHETMLTFIEQIPPRLRVLLASRADPPLRLGRLRARGQVLEIRASDLTFDSGEVQAFLRDTMGIRLPEAATSSLEARTEGWPAGLQLAALSLRTHPDTQTFLTEFSGSNRLLSTYLLDEVINALPPDRREFLLATSVVDEICAGLCAAMLGWDDPEMRAGTAVAQAVLEELETANMFIIPLDAVGGWYRYHQLFAEALRHRLCQQDPAAERTYRRRAGEWYAKSGYMYAAITQALAAQDWPAASEWIGQLAVAEDMWWRGRLNTLADWLAALPEPLQRADPRLALWRIMLLLSKNEYSSAEAWLIEAERGLVVAEEGGPAHAPLDTVTLAALRGRAAALRSWIVRVLHGDLAESHAWTQAALTLLPPDDLQWRAAAWHNLGTIAYVSAEPAQGVRLFAEAAKLSVEAGLSVQICGTQSRAAALLYDLGRLDEALTLCASARRMLAAMAKGDLPGTCNLDWVEGLFYYETGDLERAESLLQRAIAEAVQERALETEGFAYCILSRVHLARGDLAAAVRDLDRAAGALTPPNGGTTAFQLVLATWQASLQLAGSTQAPDERWTQLVSNTISGCAHWIMRPANLLPAQARLEVGDAAGALAYLEECCAQAAARGATTLLIAGLALQTLALMELGRRQRARATLLRALTLAAPGGYIRTILDAAPGIERLLHTLAGELARDPDARPAFLAYVVRLSSAALPGGTDISGGSPGVSAGESPSGVPTLLLSSREASILRLVAAGHSNQEVAAQLILAVSTVKWYLRHIYQKLGSANRTEAVARARALALIP